MDQEKSKLIGNLINAEIIKFGKFRLKSGLEANVYYDIRAIPRHPQLLKELVQLIQKWFLPKFTFDVLCGVPMGAVSITAALGYATDTPVVLLRPELKKYGLQKRIEGKLPDDTRCILIEDVTSTGQSIADAIKLLRQEKLEPIAVFVIIDRREKPSEPIENVPVVSIFIHDEINNYFVKSLTGTDTEPTLKKLKSSFETDEM